MISTSKFQSNLVAGNWNKGVIENETPGKVSEHASQSVFLFFLSLMKSCTCRCCSELVLFRWHRKCLLRIKAKLRAGSKKNFEKMLFGRVRPNGPLWTVGWSKLSRNIMGLWEVGLRFFSVSVSCGLLFGFRKSTGRAIAEGAACRFVGSLSLFYMGPTVNSTGCKLWFSKWSKKTNQDSTPPNCGWLLCEKSMQPLRVP
jgi:hypothetical protein